MGEYFDNSSINSRLTFFHVLARYFLLLLRVLALGLVEANGRELLGQRLHFLLQSANRREFFVVQNLFEVTKLLAFNFFTCLLYTSPSPRDS